MNVHVMQGENPWLDQKARYKNTTMKLQNKHAIAILTLSLLLQNTTVFLSIHRTNKNRVKIIIVIITPMTWWPHVLNINIIRLVFFVSHQMWPIVNVWYAVKKESGKLWYRPVPRKWTGVLCTVWRDFSFLNPQPKLILDRLVYDSYMMMCDTTGYEESGGKCDKNHYLGFSWMCTGNEKM